MSIKGLELYSEENFAHMKLVATSIWESGRVQKPWINNAQTVLLVMQKAHDLGMSPLAGLDHLTQFRDQGAWGISIAGAKGLVASKGGTITITADSDSLVTAVTTREGWKDHNETVTLAECDKSGVMVGKNGKKEVWVKFPRAMLRATAIRRALTHMWSDVLVGCSPFDPDLETESPADETITVTEADLKPKKNMKKQEQAALAPEEPDPQTGNVGIKISTPVEPAIIPNREATAPPLNLKDGAHRLILIEAIKKAQLTPEQTKICRDLWNAGWHERNGVMADLPSIVSGLKLCVKEAGA